ncbi:MAG: M48 family metallopeptidase [Endomicrobiales bacterium]
MSTRLSGAIFTLILAFSACSTVPITGRRQLSLVPQSQLIALSANDYRQLIAESRLSDDPGKTEMVARVGRRIAASAEQFMREHDMEKQLRGYQWEFKLIRDDKTVNAFCMPGGKVAVYTGILPVTSDENGLAVVMGHEVAHAIANHGGERMSQLLLVQLGGLTLSEALRQKPEQTRSLLMMAYGVGANVGVILPYSRGNENESDHIGLILMARAGYDPHAAVPFWERMRKQGGAEPPEFLSTHPATEKRIENIRKEIPEAMKYYRK